LRVWNRLFEENGEKFPEKHLTKEVEAKISKKLSKVSS
jgi:hypothetical protein